MIVLITEKSIDESMTVRRGVGLILWELRISWRGKALGIAIIAVLGLILLKNAIWQDVLKKAPEDFVAASSKVEVSQRTVLGENEKNKETSLLKYHVEILNKTSKPLKLREVQVINEKSLTRFFNGWYPAFKGGSGIVLEPGKSLTVKQQQVVIPRYDQMSEEDQALLSNNLQTKYVMIDYGYFAMPEYIMVTKENIGLMLE